jgi:hypothetical protein
MGGLIQKLADLRRVDSRLPDCVTMAVAASACAYAAKTKVCGYNILGHQCKIFNCDTVCSLE